MPTNKKTDDKRIPRALVFTGCSVAAVAACGGAAAAAGDVSPNANAHPFAVPDNASKLVDKAPFADRADPAPVSSPLVLASGDKGAAVTQLQRALHINVNGVFGTATQQAVVRFQRRHGLPVDGTVGPRTRRALHLRDRIVQSSSSTTATSSPSFSGGGGYSIPASIVMCESGGNYSAVNSSSGAGGAYQILPSTWAAYGGAGLPQNAPPAEQNAIAAKIYASGGASQWSCG
jgi:hypothetical protein